MFPQRAEPGVGRRHALTKGVCLIGGVAKSRRQTKYQSGDERQSSHERERSKIEAQLVEAWECTPNPEIDSGVGGRECCKQPNATPRENRSGEAAAEREQHAFR